MITWTEEQDKFLREHYHSMTYSSMCNYVGVPYRFRNRVVRRCHELGLIRPRGTEFNQDYLEVIDTPEKAYLWGYILADGNVCVDETHHDFVLRVAAKDKEHLETLRNLLSAKKELKYVKGTNSYCLGLSSKKFCDDLIRHGCLPRKSYIKIDPYIPQDFFYSFLIGFIDADGYISQCKKSYGTYISMGLLQALVNTEFIDKINARLLSDGFVMGRSLTNKLIVLRLSGKRAMSLLQRCYSSVSIYNPRKFNKYNELCQK